MYNKLLVVLPKRNSDNCRLAKKNSTLKPVKIMYLLFT